MSRFMTLCLCVLWLVSSFLMAGCGKKQETLEQMQEPLSVEVTQPTGEVSQPTLPAVAPESLQLPQGPYKPSNKEIQIALKNAGFYAGAIDGDIGSKTEKAIRDFQAANNLTVDGKVGPKTWAVLSKYLNPAPETGTTQQ